MGSSAAATAAPGGAVSMTEDAYLAFEEAAEERHELINGEVVAMAGGSTAHSLIAANFTGELRQALKGRPCLVLQSDQRVNVDATGLYTYPDLTVVCGRPQYAAKSATTITNPLVVVEVLSPATEPNDRGAKFAHYRRLPSLQACILVSIEPRRIEVFHRVADGWLLTEAEEGAIRIECLDVSLRVDEVYFNLELLAEAAE